MTIGGLEIASRLAEPRIAARLQSRGSIYFELQIDEGVHDPSVVNPIGKMLLVENPRHRWHPILGCALLAKYLEDYSDRI